MKNANIIVVHRALTQLDGYKSDKGDFIPYLFSGNGAYGIAKNLRKAKAALDLIEESRLKLLKATLKESETDLKPDDPRYKDFIKAYTEILETEGEFEPHKVKISQLNLAKNAISPSTLAALDCILVEDETTP